MGAYGARSGSKNLQNPKTAKCHFENGQQRRRHLYLCLTKVHNMFHYIIYFLIFFHILAVLIYQFFKKKSIINQMIDGKSRDKNIQIHIIPKSSIYIGFFVLIMCTVLPPLVLYIKIY